MTWVLMKFLRGQVEVGDGEGFVLGSYLHFIGKETGSQRVSGLPEARNLGLKAGSDSKLRACLSLPSCSLIPLWKFLSTRALWGCSRLACPQRMQNL